MLPLRSRRHATPTSGHEANAEGQQRSFPQPIRNRHALQHYQHRPGPCCLAKHGLVPHHCCTSSGAAVGVVCGCRRPSPRAKR